jgi:hypothetical protein
MRDILGLVLAAVAVAAFLGIGPFGGYLLVAAARAAGLQPAVLLLAMAVVLPLLVSGLRGVAYRKSPREVESGGRIVGRRKAA